MKSKAACISTLIRFVIFSVAVSGCGQTQITNLGNEAAIHENVLSDNIQVVDVHSYQLGKELVISGKVRRSCNFCCRDAQGHVDIVVLGPEGGVLTTASTLYSPRNIPKTKKRSSSFSVRLPITAPEGAVIRTAYHGDSQFAVFTSGDKTFHCSSNLALPAVQAPAVSKLNGQ